MSFQMHDKLAALLERDYAAQDALKTQFELHVCKWTHEKQTTHTKKIFLKNSIKKITLLEQTSLRTKINNHDLMRYIITSVLSQTPFFVIGCYFFMLHLIIFS